MCFMLLCICSFKTLKQAACVSCVFCRWFGGQEEGRLTCEVIIHLQGLGQQREGVSRHTPMMSHVQSQPSGPLNSSPFLLFLHSSKTSAESPSAPTLPARVTTFPPAAVTTDSVRNKCRELLVVALQTDGEEGWMDGRMDECTDGLTDL